MDADRLGDTVPPQLTRLLVEAGVDRRTLLGIEGVSAPGGVVLRCGIH